MAISFQEKTLGFLRLTRPRVEVGYVIAGASGLFIGFAGLPGDLGGSLLVLAAIIAGTSGIYMLNDVFDYQSDMIDSPGRPIPSGIVGRREASYLSLLLMSVSIALAYAISANTFVLVFCLVAIGIIYSVPPARLKRIFLAPNVCVALLGALTFLIGASIGPMYSARAVFVGLLILAYGTAAGFVKEFKDVEGDTAVGVRTLPVILGVDRSARIAVACLLLAYGFFVVPYFILELNIIYPALISLLFVYTVWYSLHFLKGPKDKDSRQRFYDRTLQMSITLFAALILGSL